MMMITESCFLWFNCFDHGLSAESHGRLPLKYILIYDSRHTQASTHKNVFFCLHFYDGRHRTFGKKLERPVVSNEVDLALTKELGG